MTYTEIRVETQEKLDQFFRFGQEFTHATVQFAINRNPYASLLTEGVIDDAIGKAFDITDPDGNTVDWNETIQDILSANWKYVKLAGKYERAFGKSLIQLFEDEDNTLLIRAVHPKDYTANYLRNGSIKKLEIRSRTVDGDFFTHRTEGDDTTLDMDFVHEILLRPTDKIGEGRSAIEKVWDQLYALSVLDENATYFVIRVGGGLKIMKVPASKLQDKTTRNKIKKQVKEVNSGNGIMIIPIFEDLEDSKQAEFSLESGDQIDFISVRDLLLGSISVATGIPREVLLGSELGLRSAETNQSAYFAFLEEIQHDYKPIMKWLVRTIISTIEGIPDDVEFKIKWNVREAQDEQKETDILSKKIDDAVKLIDAGFTSESVLKLLDLEELELDEPDEPEDDATNTVEQMIFDPNTQTNGVDGQVEPPTENRANIGEIPA